MSPTRRTRRRPPAIGWGAASWRRLEGGGVRLVLPVPPSGNRQVRTARGGHYTPDHVTAYRNGVATMLARCPQLHGDVRLAITWVRASRRGDVDNRVKTLQDALRGVAFTDDAQVAVGAQQRVDDADTPAGAVVDVVPAGVPVCCPNCGVPLDAIVLPPAGVLRDVAGVRRAA